MKGNSNSTQTQRILDYLQTHDGITQYDALRELGIMRLGARIFELKKSGYRFEGQMTNVKNRYGETCKVKRYTLKGGCNG